jgi:hypothetical protein
MPITVIMSERIARTATRRTLIVRLFSMYGSGPRARAL